MKKKRLTLYYIQEVYRLRNALDVVKEIWVTLVHTLKGEYDATKGDSDVWLNGSLLMASMGIV